MLNTNPNLSFPPPHPHPYLAPKKPMIEFTFLFLFRVLSGIQNAFGYAGRARHRFIVTIILIGAALAACWWIAIQPVNTLLRTVAIMAAALAAVGAYGVEDSFDDSIALFPTDIHLFETIATGAITVAIALAGGNIIMVACSIYPALLLHKGAINLGGGLPFWDPRTDDPTGKTFHIPLLNIRVPRSTNAVRITIAALSLALVALSTYFGWRIGI